jgi:hypothetical protein
MYSISCGVLTVTLVISAAVGVAVYFRTRSVVTAIFAVAAGCALGVLGSFGYALLRG